MLSPSCQPYKPQSRAKTTKGMVSAAHFSLALYGRVPVRLSRSMLNHYEKTSDEPQEE